MSHPSLTPLGLPQWLVGFRTTPDSTASAVTANREDRVVRKPMNHRDRPDGGKAIPMVLHVRVVTGSGGGPEKTILNSPRFLKSLGYDCACAYLHPPSDPGFATLQARANELNAELISVPDRGATDWRVVRHLLRICRERNVSIWHGHDHKSNAIGLLLRRFHPMKLVSTVHGWIVTNRKLEAYRKVDLACLRRYDEVICVSAALFDECLANGVPLERCRVIENAIDLSRYVAVIAPRDEPNASSAEVLSQNEGASDIRLVTRSDDGYVRDGYVVLAIGRLSPEKGFDVLIRSVDLLVEAGTDVRLLIAGEGSERANLERLIEENGRGERIKLLGHVADPRSLFAAADAFVLSSRSEGLPNVLLESLACGVPVIATAVGGVPRVIADEVNGLLVRPDDADGLSVALSRLLHNDALKSSLSVAGRRTVEERYGFDARMRKVVAVYDGACRLGTLARREENKDGQECPSSGVSVTADPRGWREFLAKHGYAGFQQWPEWSQALAKGLGHRSFFVQAKQGSELVGVLPLQLVESRLFGRFLVSLPYVNTAGVVAESDSIAMALVGRAIELADALDVKHLELRHERAIEHPKLIAGVTDKVHMRLPLPATSEELWDSIKAKVRNQIRKAQKTDGFSVAWGGEELLPEFYDIFCRNMRDLGTPPFSRRLFAEILRAFPNRSTWRAGCRQAPNMVDDAECPGANALRLAESAAAELCVVRLNGRAVASGLLVHGPGTTQVPSASSLREFNSTNANMLLYWSLLTRSIERGQREFDFGRSTRDGGTYKFKAQWGAVEHPAVWQHYVRRGQASDMRPTSGKFQKAIQIWQRLPVWLTKLIGPGIVRGIP